MDDLPEKEEKNLMLRFQEIFDLRYVFRNDYNRLEKGLLWIGALFITSIISLAIAYVSHH